MTATIQPYNPVVNCEQALLWQYNEALRLQSLVMGKQDWYNVNQTEFWDNWVTDVFDLKTANYFGLSVWSIILGQPIVFTDVGNPDKVAWGFGTYHANFTRGNFASKYGFVYALSTESARIVLRLRYYQLIGTCTIPAMNRMLKDIFSDYGTAYVLDGLDMTQTYIFNFTLPADLAYIFSNADILPRPAGVKSTYEVLVNESWGFGDYHENFDHGNFSEG